jgi:aspartyl-tRNA(Asn)/glutamyl-tRNA(Gln) amidotransferase subunit A
MISSDPRQWTIAGLSFALRKKLISPVEVVRAYLKRIEAHDGRINAFLTLLPGPALKAARRAEQEIVKGRYRGPLHGIPYAAKDLFFTRGIRTTCGSKILADFKPRYDGAVIERLSAAGAVLLGKLNMHEFAYGTTSVNPHYGPVRNPWDPERVTGGSSGGSAAALAASFAPLTLGTDTGGSIRIPASLCGTVGLKPTYGRVSRRGAYPLCWSLDHIGPMTKTAVDCAIALNTIAGHDPGDPASAAVPVPDYTRSLFRDLKGVRIGIPDSYYFERLEGDVAKAVAGAIRHLRSLGARIRPVTIPDLEEAAMAAFIGLVAEGAASLEKWHRTRPEDLGGDVLSRLNVGAAVTAAQYLKAMRIRRRILDHFQKTFAKVEAIVTPQLPITAPKIGQASVSLGKTEEPVPAALTRFTRIYNLIGIPAMSIPCGLSSAGLPVGLQIAARPFDEETVLGIGCAYEVAGPGAGLNPAWD